MHRFRFNRLSEPRILASDPSGRTWEVMVIKAGLSNNFSPDGYRFHYGPEMLEKAVPLFEGVPAYAFDFKPEYFNHVPAPGLPIKNRAGIAKNKVGKYSDPHSGTDVANAAQQAKIVNSLVLLMIPNK